MASLSELTSLVVAGSGGFFLGGLLVAVWRSEGVARMFGGSDGEMAVQAVSAAVAALWMSSG